MREVVKRSLILLLSLFALSLGTAHADSDGPQTVRVDCADEETLAKALERKHHTKPLIVEFTGTCTGNVEIPDDDITLRGADSSATVIGTVSVIGRSRVTLENFTIRDTPIGNPTTRDGNGIVAVAAQYVTLQGMTVLNTGNIGIDIEDSTVIVIDTTSNGSRRFGLAAVFGSVVEVKGTLTTTGNRLGGIVITDTAQIQFYTRARVITTDNQGPGLIVQLHGRATLHGGVVLDVKRNGGGILVVDLGNLVYGFATINISENLGFGLQVGQLADWTLIAATGSNVNITNNLGPGVIVSRQAFVRLRENTTITGNAGPGIVVDGAGVAIRGATIQGNNNGNGDVVLVFGTNATFDAPSTIGTPIFCDGTVLVRGAHACGAPLTAAQAAAASVTPADAVDLAGPVAVREIEPE